MRRYNALCDNVKWACRAIFDPAEPSPCLIQALAACTQPDKENCCYDSCTSPVPWPRAIEKWWVVCLFLISRFTGIKLNSIR